MPTKAPKPCAKGCGRKTHRNGLCREHYRRQDHARGTASQRGYTGAGHSQRFRVGVLAAANHQCALCPAVATVADHYPRTRKQLIADGCDPDNPAYGRALCESCHNRHTASTSIARRDA